MIFQHHLQDVKSIPEDAACQSAQCGFPRIVDGNIVHHLDELLRDAKKLRLVEAVLDQCVQHLQGAVQLAVRGGRYDGQQLVEQVGPLLGEVAAGDLADDEAGGGLELAVELVGGGQVEQQGAHLVLDGVGDDEGALELLEVVAPAGEHDLLEVQQGGLSYVEGHAIMAGNVDEGDGEVLVGVETLQLLLGLFAGGILGSLCCRQQLH